MGLDNIPHEYPCKARGTAVMVGEGEDSQIDCKTTQAANGCPWQESYNRSHPGTPIYGMIGTSCWYRGKAGTWMLERLEEAGYDPPSGGFYGDQCDHASGLDGTAEHAEALAKWMEDHAETYADLTSKALEAQYAEPEEQPDWHGADPPSWWKPRPALEERMKEELEHYRYAAWWLRWVGKECGGFHAWY
jgi:hypothetical protein